MRLSAVQQYTLVDYPGVIACVAFTPGCNFRCPYCHNPEMVMPEQIRAGAGEMIPEETFFNFLKERQGLLEGVSICGGEPTLHRDLPQFAEQIKMLGFNVKLDTNGSNADMVIDMVEQGLLDYIAVDCKTTPGGPKLATGVTLSDQFWVSYRCLLDYLRESMLSHEYRTTVVKGVHTLDDIKQIATFLQGVDAYYLQQYRSEITLDPNFEGSSFTEFELSDMLKVAHKKIPRSFLRV